MKKSVLENVTRKVRAADEVLLCRSFWTRMKGLLGTQKLPEQSACWIEPCNSIHTLGMAYAIDAYFLDREGRVMAMEKNLKPNRLSKIYPGARSVVEMLSGPSRPIEVGDQLVLRIEETK